MASMEDWRVRRAIQHWSIVAFGLLIPAAAFLADPSDIDIPMNATLLSLVLLSSTAFELVRLYAWQDASALLCGLWSAVSPFAFGYGGAGQLRYWHATFGAMLMLLASFNKSVRNFHDPFRSLIIRRSMSRIWRE